MHGILRKAIAASGTAVLIAGLSTTSSFGSVISGHWSISDVLSSKTCSAQLSAEPAVSGHGNAFVTENCQGIYAPITKATAWQWSYEEGLSLLDGDGKIVLQFDLDELDGLTSVGLSSLFLIMEPIRQDSKAPGLSDLIEKAIVVTAQR